MSEKVVVNCTNAPAAIGPYSQAVKVNGMLYISGQLPLDHESGELITDDIAAATHKCLQNIRAILHEEGQSFIGIVKTTIYMTDLGKFSEMNEAYGVYFRGQPPARACVEVSALPKGAPIEIEAIAALQEAGYRGSLGSDTQIMRSPFSNPNNPTI